MSSAREQTVLAQPRGLVFDLQRFSIHNGPGLRTTVFLKGCPADCWWCHNPEARAFDPELSIRPARCIRCGACLEACPHGAAVEIEGEPAADADRCRRCGACAEACPTGTRQIVGRSVSVDEVLNEVERDAVFYGSSLDSDGGQGGVTFSGGEPLAQPEFLLGCLQAARQRGLHSAVDTCGAAPRAVLLRAAGLSDLVLYDLKLMDDARHRRFVGISNRTILRNLVALAEAAVPVWVRVPLIPGVNDDPANLETLGSFVRALGTHYPLFLLPYHRLGADKHRRLGKSWRLGDLAPPAAAQVSAAVERLRTYDLEVHVGA